MKIFKNIIFIFCILSLLSCGNRGSNQLAKGVIDKSGYPYPPDPTFDYPGELNEEEFNDSLIDFLEKNVP